MFKKISVAAFLLAISAACLPALSQSGTAQNVQIGAQVVFGLQNQFPDTIFQYQEPATTTAQMSSSTVVAIPANSTNNAISTSTLFPGFTTPVCWGIAEITSPSLPLNIGLSSGGPRLQVAGAGFLLVRTVAGKPTFYIDNPSVNQAALVRIFGLSN